MTKVLIFGGKGFVGRHLTKFLNDKFEVISVGKEYDVTNKLLISSLVSKVKPDLVINLAFITTVKQTFEMPDKTYEIGFYGTLNILNALKDINFKGRYLNVSSSEVYGFPSIEDLPLTENSSLSPMSPYSVAKLSTEYLCHQWVKVTGIDIITARPFTHIGPGQSDRFSLSNFAKQIAEIKLGLREPIIEVGSLDSTRDITDVRDISRAYFLLLKNGKKGEVYNICSEVELSMKNYLDVLIDISGISMKVSQTKNLMRKNEQKRIIGNYSKIYKHVKWEPKIELKKTFRDMIIFFEKKLNYILNFD